MLIASIAISLGVLVAVGVAGIVAVSVATVVFALVARVVSLFFVSGAHIFVYDSQLKLLNNCGCDSVAGVAQG